MIEALLDEGTMHDPRQPQLTGWVGKQVLVERVFYHADGTEDRLRLAQGEVVQEPDCFGEANICGRACNRLHFYRIQTSEDANKLRVILAAPDQITSESYIRMEISSAEPATSN